MPSKRKTTATKEDAKPALVPKLRFPEFRDPGTWQRMPLGLMLSEHGQKSDGEADVHSVSLTHGVVSQLEHMGRSYAAADTSHYSLVRPFDVVYTRSPLAIYRLGIVKQHRGPKNAIISPLYGVFEPANRHIGYIVEAYFDSPSRSISYLDPLAQKGAKNTIQLSNERFLSGEIVLPTDEAEQQKIAECLSSLDELIGAQGRKLDALKTYKKGLMQQLFPREGETQPRLRFPEFQDSGDWEETTIGSICRLKAGEFIPASDIKDGFQDGMFPCYGGNGRRGYVHSSTHEGLYVLIGRQGALCGNVNLISGRFHATEHALVVTPQEGYAPDWLFYAFNDLNLNRFSIGQAQPGLSVGVLNNVSIVVPHSRDEQQRIASCLSSLDDLITAEVQRLDALKTHKRGLMQQLFPSREDS